MPRLPLHPAMSRLNQKKSISQGAPSRRRPTIALALGGGGARGLAHILMLEALDEFGIRPTIIAGTSIGAIFGAAYAAGLSAVAIRAHAEEVLRQRFDILRQVFAARNARLPRLLSVLQLKSAFLNPEVLLDIMMPRGVPETFSELEIPLKVVAADFFRQEQVVIESGPLRPAVAASMALPLLFAPVLSHGRALMDGGLVNPLPFDLIAGAADITIAIDVSGASRASDRKTPPSAFETLVSTSQILQHTIVREKLKSRQPDIYIEVAGNHYVHEFHKLGNVLAAAEPAKRLFRQKLAHVLGASTLVP